MMVCSKAMINVARKMEERYGIPFFEGSFYGIGDMSDVLREIARLLVDRGAPAELLERTEVVIAREEARAWARIDPYKSAAAPASACCSSPAASSRGPWWRRCRKPASKSSAPASRSRPRKTRSASRS